MTTKLLLAVGNEALLLAWYIVIMVGVAFFVRLCIIKNYECVRRGQFLLTRGSARSANLFFFCDVI